MEEAELRFATIFEQEQEFARLLGDPDLKLSKRGRSLLTYLIEAKLQGATHVDPRNIAQMVLGRGQNFDPTSDPIVRMEMTRLRAALKHHYESRLEKDLCVAIAPRNYLPVIEYWEAHDNITSATSSSSTPSQLERPADVSTGPKLLERIEFYTVVAGSGLVMLGGTALAMALLF